MNRRVLSRVFGISTLMLLLGVCLLGAPQTQQPNPAPATGAISGVVTDGATNQPLTGVVMSLSASGRGGNIATRTITDSKGRFVFDHLPQSGGYVLRANKFGYTDAIGQQYRINASLTLAEGQWIADADMILWPPAAVSGTVVDEAGEPIVGIPVRVLPQVPVAGVWQGAAGPITTTDDRGFYRIAGLPGGRYVVTVSSVQSVVPVATVAAADPAKTVGLILGDARLIVGNYATPPAPAGTRLQAYPTMFYPNVRSVAVAKALDLSDGEERRNVDFALAPVPTARISGVVTGPPEAVNNLVLRLMPEGSENLGIGSETATSLVGPGGRFTLIGVPTGSYTLDARAAVSELLTRGAAIMVGLPPTPGLVSQTGSGTPIGVAPEGVLLSTRNTATDDTYFARVHVEIGADDIDNVQVVLRPTGQISGRFVYEGTPPKDGFVSAAAEPADGSAALSVSAPLVRPQSGAPPPETFVVKGLKAGQYLLRVTAGTVVVKSIMAAGIDYTDRPFDMTSTSGVTDVVVTLTDKIGSIVGDVRDKQGALAKEARIVVFPADPTLWTRFGYRPPRIRSTTLSSTGRYGLGLPQGDYYVIALAASIRDAWMNPDFFKTAASVATRVSLGWGESRVQDLQLSQVTIK